MLPRGCVGVVVVHRIGVGVESWPDPFEAALSRIEVRKVEIPRFQGRRDRFTTLPDSLRPALTKHLEVLRKTHAADLAAGSCGVTLPDAIERKLGSASRD
jgi:hypothetical protein